MVLLFFRCGRCESAQWTYQEREKERKEGRKKKERDWSCESYKRLNYLVATCYMSPSNKYPFSLVIGEDQKITQYAYYIDFIISWYCLN